MDQDLFDVHVRRHALTADDVQVLLETLQQTRDMMRAEWAKAVRGEEVFDDDLDLYPDTRLDMQGLPLLNL